MRIPLTLSCVVVAAVAIGAQEVTQFEVASVKPSNPAAGSPVARTPLLLPPVGGRLTATNVTVKQLVQFAYGLQSFQVAGGPAWVESERFDVQAKAADSSAAMAAVQPMLKALLADRFALRLHMETRELPMSALVLARRDGSLGAKLEPSAADCAGAQARADMLAEVLAKGGPAALAAAMPTPGDVVPCAVSPSLTPDGMGMRGNGVPMALLARFLTAVLGRVVEDRTGLIGLYDWELVFDPEILMRVAAEQAGVNIPLPAAPSDAPALLTALRQDLGLDLEGTRGPVDVLVIDSVERPAPD